MTRKREYTMESINIIGDHPFYTFYLGQLPSNIYDSIKQEVNSFKSEKQLERYQHLLEGHIDHEYAFNLPTVAYDYLFDKCQEYMSDQAVYKLPEIYVSRFSATEVTVGLNTQTSAWINFQKKHEYNPMHHHGGFLSFVIWYQVPYLKSDEDKFGPGKDKAENDRAAKHNGNFYFVTNPGGHAQMVDLPVDKSWEGRYAIFPSQLQHGVNPFYTSDDYRITISNNFFLEIQR